MTGFAFSSVANISSDHDFEWPLPAACITSLCNRTHTEFGKPHEIHGPLCALKIFQWCVGLYVVGVKVALLLTVGQSIYLGVELHLTLMTCYLLTIWQLRSCPIRAPSLTRGQVCLLSIIVSSLCQYVQRVFYNLAYFTWSCVIHYIQGLCQSRLGTADYALLIVAKATMAI
jgi:hypothetical protein